MKKLNKDNNIKIKMNFFINNCINIENHIKNIYRINDKIKAFNNLSSLNIKFVPEKEDEINNFIDKIKSFGKLITINLDNCFNDSLIIKNNQSYVQNLINWISPDLKFKTELLYRKTRDGDSYDSFHKLCDNQGKTLVLIHADEGFIIGGYTPLNWDNYSSWKNDDDTFLFSLTNNKIFRKIRKSIDSIYCSKDSGPWFAYIGFLKYNNRSNMSEGQFLYRNSDIYFNDINNIIPNEKKDRFFNANEVEVYKILFK